MASKVTSEDIVRINELYVKYKTYAEVARQTGFSASTIKKYVVSNYTPKDSIKINTFSESIPEVCPFVFPKSEADWHQLLALSEIENQKILDLQKEVLI